MTISLAGFGKSIQTQAGVTNVQIANRKSRLDLQCRGTAPA